MSLTVIRYFPRVQSRRISKVSGGIISSGNFRATKTNKDYTKISAILISENHKVLKLQNVENSLGSECCMHGCLHAVDGLVRVPQAIHAS